MDPREHQNWAHVMGRSIVLSEIKTEVPLENDDPAYQSFLLHPYEERIERLSQQDKLSKICLDAGFLSVVEIGQYFMTKDTGDLTQFHAVACREYTLPMEEGALQPRGWIQGKTKIGPVLEVTTSCLHGNIGVEIKIWSLNGDNTHSWVRISHGSNKFVINSNNNDTEVPEDQHEEQASHLNAEEFVSQPKAKPPRREPADSSSRIIPMNRRNWIDVKPGEHSLSAYEVFEECNSSSSTISASTSRRGWSGYFWRMKEKLQNQFPQSIHWSDDRWKACLAAGGGGAQKRYQYQEQLFISEFFKDIQGAILLILD